MLLRIAGKVGESIVDGPGIRYVLFTQGCPHHCEGCHNPETWSFDEGKFIDSAEICAEIDKDLLLDGITYSGGEPFCQCHALAALTDELKKLLGVRPFGVMSFTGFEFEYLVEHANEENGYMELLSRLDHLVDGRFVLEKRTLELPFRGSSNQRYIDVQASLKAGYVIECEPF